MRTRQVTAFGVMAAAVLGVLLVAGCASSSTSSAAGAGDRAKQPTASVRDQLADEWLAVSIQGEPVDKMMAGVPIREFPSLALVEGDRVGGSTAVNRWSAPLDMAKAETGAFVLGPAISTRMAGPPEAMKVERRFLDALGAARTYSIADRQLILKDADGKDVLRLSKVGGA